MNTQLAESLDSHSETSPQPEPYDCGRMGIRARHISPPKLTYIFPCFRDRHRNPVIRRRNAKEHGQVPDALLYPETTEMLLSHT